MPDIPVLRWPSQAHLTPKRCWNCGSELLDPDLPYGLRKTGSVTCALCSRTVVDLVEDAVTRTVPLAPTAKRRDPSAPRNWNAAYRARLKAGLVTRARWATNYDACVGCGGTSKPHHARGKCYGCRDRSREREQERLRRAAR